MKENNQEIIKSEAFEIKSLSTEEQNEQIHGPGFTNASKYSALEQGQQLMNRTYTVDGREATTKKDSKEMTEVLEGLDALNEVFDMVEFDTSNKALFVNSGMTILDMMKNVASRCDKYIAAKNPWFKEGQVRKELVRKISERVNKDIIGMEEKLKAFWMLPEEERARINSWTDFLNWERTINYKDGEDGVTISHTGGNTSDVIIIEKEGKRLFFKKESKLPSDDMDHIVGDLQEKMIEENAKSVETKGSPEYYKYRFLQAFSGEFQRKVTHLERFQKLLNIDTSKDPYTNLMKALASYELLDNGVIKDQLERVDRIEDEEKRRQVQLALWDAFQALRKEYLGAGVGTGTAQIQAGEEMAKRNVATSRLAHLMGLDHLVPNSEMATIEVNGEKMYGVVMEDTGGEVTDELVYDNKKEEYAGKKLQYSADGFRDCFLLQIFDAICGQIDRHEANRMLKLHTRHKDPNSLTVNGVKGIDGDMSFGNLTYSDLKSKFPALEDGNGLSLPISEDTAMAILELDLAVVNYEMMGILNENERKSLVDRLTGVQKAIRKRMDYEKKNPKEQSLILSGEAWAQYANKLRSDVRKDRKLRKKISNDTYIDIPLLTGTKIKAPNHE